MTLITRQRNIVLTLLLAVMSATSECAESLTLREKAERGDAKAQYTEGFMAENPVEAVHWFRKAAEQGYAPAQSSLGNRYYSGLGVEKDFAQAVAWFRKAVEQDYADAKYRLGLCYHSGNGTEMDLVKAAIWYRKAAEQGDVHGQFYLGVCLERGEGVPKDFVESTMWFQKAAEQGHAASQFFVGNCLADGRGIAKDKIQAYAFLNLAGVSLEAARSNLSRLETELTQEQIAEGQKRTKELQKQIEAKISAK
jgi:TPR repeat protein